MFGWVDFRKDGKKNWEKIGEETFLVSVWLKGEEGKKPARPKYFLSKLTKCFLPKLERKLEKT